MKLKKTVSFEPGLNLSDSDDEKQAVPVDRPWKSESLYVSNSENLYVPNYTDSEKWGA